MSRKRNETDAYVDSVLKDDIKRRPFTPEADFMRDQNVIHGGSSTAPRVHRIGNVEYDWEPFASSAERVVRTVRHALNPLGRKK